MEERARDLDYYRVTPKFFAISKYANENVIYRRCNFSKAGAMHCVDLAYPRHEEAGWDDAVTRISRSLRPSGG